MSNGTSMTPQEVMTHIDSQTQWSLEEKAAVRSLYECYISTLSAPTGSYLAERGEGWKKQLLQFGITV